MSSAYCVHHGASAVFQDILLLVGPYGDWVKYSLEEPAVLVTECDGVSSISRPLLPSLIRPILMGCRRRGAPKYYGLPRFQAQTPMNEQRIRIIALSIPICVPHKLTTLLAKDPKGLQACKSCR